MIIATDTKADLNHFHKEKKIGSVTRRGAAPTAIGQWFWAAGAATLIKVGLDDKTAQFLDLNQPVQTVSLDTEGREQ